MCTRKAKKCLPTVRELCVRVQLFRTRILLLIGFIGSDTPSVAVITKFETNDTVNHLKLEVKTVENLAPTYYLLVRYTCVCRVVRQSQITSFALSIAIRESVRVRVSESFGVSYIYAYDRPYTAEGFLVQNIK